MGEEWVKTPEVRVTVEHGKGKSVVRGPVRIAFTGARYAHVTTEAHHNDDLPTIVFREKEWLASAHVERSDSGEWVLRDPRATYGISERGVIGYGKDTPRTYRDAINAALLAAVAKAWTPELARAAEYASAMQALPQARKDAAEAAEAARVAAARLAELEQHAAQSAPVTA